MTKMPLNLKEMCYLRITGNVNPENLPGKCEKYDHLYLWSKCKLSYHTCKQLCNWCYISTCKRHGRVSDDKQIMSVCVGGTIFTEKWLRVQEAAWSQWSFDGGAVVPLAQAPSWFKC